MNSTLSEKTRAAFVVAMALAVAPLGLGAEAKGPPHCPPGHAKKGLCSPNGHGQGHAGHHRWHRGDHIPRDVDVRVIVHHDRYRVRPPERGQVYVDVGGEIYLIAEATNRVIEAVNLVDAATR